MKIWQIILISVFVLSWIILAAYLVIDVQKNITTSITAININENSHWLTAPDRTRTAVLVRDYGFDLNFRLFIIEPGSGIIPTDIHQALWTSKDFNPDPTTNWGEEINWTDDSSVIYVFVKNQPVYAYDFKTKQEYETPITIQNLLEKNNQ